MLTDARGRPLIYADRVAIIPSGRGGSVGLAGITFAPGILERLGQRFPTIQVRSGNRPRIVLHGLQLSFHAGEQRQPEGGWHVQAAVGTYRLLDAP